MEMTFKSFINSIHCNTLFESMICEFCNYICAGVSFKITTVYNNYYYICN